MSYRLLNIGLMFPGVPKVLDLEPIFNGLGDWIRYAQTGWLLWSDLPSNEILASIMLAIDKDDLVVVSPIKEGEFSAKLTPWMWQWVRGKLPTVVTADDDPEYFSRLLASRKS